MSRPSCSGGLSRTPPAFSWRGRPPAAAAWARTAPSSPRSPTTSRAPTLTNSLAWQTRRRWAWLLLLTARESWWPKRSRKPTACQSRRSRCRRSRWRRISGGWPRLSSRRSGPTSTVQIWNPLRSRSGACLLPRKRRSERHKILS